MTWRFIFISLILLLPACDSGGQTDDAATADTIAADDERIARTVIERGPLKVTVEVEPKQARLSDEPTLTLTMDAEQGVEVLKPPFGESVGAFIIRDFREPLPEIKDGRTITKQIYTLGPTQTGDLPIFPIKVTFIDNRPDGDGQEHSLETEGLEVIVASALDTEAPSLGELKPPAPPMELPRQPMNPWWWTLPGALVVIAALILRLRARRKEEVPLEKKLSPQELAFLEFQKLLEENWLEVDIKIFYVELTGIVRRFIERTTQIRAPEQTTEEFLHEIGKKTVFAEAERDKLQRFLESADLVKFAAFKPGKEEIEDSFRRAKIFIGLEGEEVAA